MLGEICVCGCHVCTCVPVRDVYVCCVGVMCVCVYMCACDVKIVGV